MLSKPNKTLGLWALGLIAFTLLFRLADQPPNFSPVIAVALFSGFLFKKNWQAILVIVSIMFISDLALGLYSGAPVVYLSLCMVALMGRGLKNTPGSFGGAAKPLKTFLGLSAGAVLFYLVTNFAWWGLYELYPKNWSGLIGSYTAALPFFRNSLASSYLYGGLLFGSYALVRRRLQIYAEAN